MTASTIEWTDFTFNIWSGCAKVHAGCTNCYAEALPPSMRRTAKWGEVWAGGQRIMAPGAYLQQAHKWAREAVNAGERRKVFCASVSDVLEVPAWPPALRAPAAVVANAPEMRVIEARAAMDEQRARLWPLIEQTVAPGVAEPLLANWTEMPGLDYLLLTKRPENWHLVPEHIRPLVWLGTSVSDQKTADEWVPRLLEAQGFRYRFLSVEPLLGPVDLARWLWPTCWHWDARFKTPAESLAAGAYAERKRQALVSAEARHIDWVIVGGESGRKARPCNVEWVRSIVRQCREAGVPCFVKQLGANVRCDSEEDRRSHLWEAMPDGTMRLYLTDSKGGDWSEWPEDLRVREFPR